MSIKFMTWAWEQPLQPVKKLTLLKIADNANDSGVAFPSIKSLAKHCSISQRTVQRIIQSLAAEGLITVEKRYRDDGSQSSNYYTLRPNFPTSNNLSPTPDITSKHHFQESPPGCHNSVTPKTTNDPFVNEPLENNFCFFYPEDFSAEDKINATSQLLDLLPEQAQLILDELAGRMRISEIREPLRYLNRLIANVRSGTFIPELATKVQANRKAASAYKTRKTTVFVPTDVGEAILPKLPEAMQASMRLIRKNIGVIK